MLRLIKRQTWLGKNRHIYVADFKLIHLGGEYDLLAGLGRDSAPLGILLFNRCHGACNLALGSSSARGNGYLLRCRAVLRNAVENALLFGRC